MFKEQILSFFFKPIYVYFFKRTFQWTALCVHSLLRSCVSVLEVIISFHILQNIYLQCMYIRYGNIYFYANDCNSISTRGYGVACKKFIEMSLRTFKTSSLIRIWRTSHPGNCADKSFDWLASYLIFSNHPTTKASKREKC